MTIDIEKAVNLPHAAFYIRLMMAFNDLAMISRLDLFLFRENKKHTDSLPSFMIQGFNSYLTRMDTSHLVEMTNAFVTKLLPVANTKTEPLSSQLYSVEGPLLLLIRQNKKADLFHQKLAQMMFVTDDSKTIYSFDAKGNREKSALYKSLEHVRHNHGFHYNHDSGGKLTEKVLEQYAVAYISERGVRRPAFETDGGFNFRYSLADEIQQASAIIKSDLPLLCDDDETFVNLAEFKDLKNFRSNLAKTMLRFVDCMISTWVEDNQLELKT